MTGFKNHEGNMREHGGNMAEMLEHDGNMVGACGERAGAPRGTGGCRRWCRLFPVVPRFGAPAVAAGTVGVEAGGGEGH